MKKLLSLSAIILLSACALTSIKTGQVALVTKDYKENPKEVQYTNLPANGTKTGRACAMNILGVFATGDMTVEAAKRNGGISHITSVTQEVNNLIVMSEVCTVVKGN